MWVWELILWEKGPTSRGVHYLLFLADSDPGLDVGEGVHGGEHGVPAMLFVQLSPGPPLQGEGGGVHEPPEVEVLLEVGHPVFHLILIEVRLHKSDLYVGLREGRGEETARDEPFSQRDEWSRGGACWDRAQHSFPIWKTTNAKRLSLEVRICPFSSPP